jgi:hypothetical protein
MMVPQGSIRSAHSFRHAFACSRPLDIIVSASQTRGGTRRGANSQGGLPLDGNLDLDDWSGGTHVFVSGHGGDILRESAHPVRHRRLAAARR